MQTQYFDPQSVGQYVVYYLVKGQELCIFLQRYEMLLILSSCYFTNIISEGSEYLPTSESRLRLETLNLTFCEHFLPYRLKVCVKANKNVYENLGSTGITVSILVHNIYLYN